MSVVSLPDVCYVASTVMTVRHVSRPQCCWELMLSYISKSTRKTKLPTHPSENLVETVGASISLLESNMAKVAHMGLVEEKITVSIKETVDFGWIGSSGCSLHSQKIVDDIVRGVTRIAIPWWCKRKNTSLNEAKRQRAIKRKLKILSHK